MVIRERASIINGSQVGVCEKHGWFDASNRCWKCSPRGKGYEKVRHYIPELSNVLDKNALALLMNTTDRRFYNLTTGEVKEVRNSKSTWDVTFTFPKKYINTDDIHDLVLNDYVHMTGMISFDADYAYKKLSRLSLDRLNKLQSFMHMGKDTEELLESQQYVDAKIIEMPCSYCRKPAGYTHAYGAKPFFCSKKCAEDWKARISKHPQYEVFYIGNKLRHRKISWFDTGISYVFVDMRKENMKRRAVNVFRAMLKDQELIAPDSCMTVTELINLLPDLTEGRL